MAASSIISSGSHARLLWADSGTDESVTVAGTDGDYPPFDRDTPSFRPDLPWPGIRV